MLGIKGKANEVWIKTNECCLGMKKMTSADECERNETLELRWIHKLIKKTENQIRRVDKLMIHQNSGSIMEDPLLALACQYLLSDFRSAASNLEWSLESMKYTVDSHHFQFITDIQYDLRYFMKNGNDIVHAHDISELGTLTPDGKKFKIQQEIAMLIYDDSRRKSPSLNSRLHKLNELFRITKKNI